MKVVRYSVNVLATIAIGFFLSRYVDSLPYELPALPASIAFLMRTFGIDSVSNADDIEAIGLSAIIVVSLLVAGLLVWLLNLIARRLRFSRRSSVSDEYRDPTSAARFLEPGRHKNTTTGVFSTATIPS